MKSIITRLQLLTLMMLISGITAMAQQPADKGVSEYSPRLQQILKPSSLHYWLDILPEVKINPGAFLDDYKKDMGLTGGDAFKLLRKENDRDGNSHDRFQQYYKGIKIEGAECIVHELKGAVKSANGRWVSNMNAPTAANITEAQALSNALASIPTKDYLWTRKDAADIQKLVKQKDLSLQPKGELVFTRINRNGDFTASNITLAWKFTLLVLPMNASATVYVDAAKGNVIAKQPVVQDCTVGSGATTWYGTRSFSTSWVGWPYNTFYLDVDEAGCSGYTNIMSRRGDPIIPYNYGDGDNSWFDADGVNGYNMRAGVTTHWSLINAYNYWRYVQGRLSYDNSNSELLAYSEMTGGLFLPDPNNANWNPVFHSLQFGAGSTSAATDDWNCIDIVGHEMTHGVVQFAAGLDYSYESGALNESFADIFGEMIDNYATGTLDWLMGEDRGAIRNMSNPSAFSHPDTYTGTYWITSSWDDGGVHENSGVQNYWFYLLTSGGSGTNDFGKAYAVSGIGQSAASAIAYRNLDLYLVSSSVYADAREGAIRAAEDLYGSCSNQVIQTAKAWYAVGVGYDQYVNGGSLCGSYNAFIFNYTFKNPDAIDVGRYCTVNFSSTGTASNTIQSGTSITFYPGATLSPSFNAYISSCAVAAYSITPEQQPASETTSITSGNRNSEQLTKNVSAVKGSSVYPNPAADHLTINAAAAIQRTGCFITDVSGRKFICTFRTDNVIDVSKLSPGTYFLHLATNNKTETVKFIKQ